MKRQPDWAAARDPLAPWLADAAIVLTTNELSALYYLGRYDVLISKAGYQRSGMAASSVSTRGPAGR